MSPRILQVFERRFRVAVPMRRFCTEFPIGQSTRGFAQHLQVVAFRQRHGRFSRSKRSRSNCYRVYINLMAKGKSLAVKLVQPVAGELRQHLFFEVVIKARKYWIDLALAAPARDLFAKRQR